MILFIAALAVQFPSGLEGYPQPGATAAPAPAPTVSPAPRARPPARRAAAATAPGKPARCTLTYGDANWSGRCRVVIDRGGTFTVNPFTGEQLPGGLLAVSVGVFAPGEAEIRGLTVNGINSRWGPARRSQRDPACWEGPSYSVCAY